MKKILLICVLLLCIMTCSCTRSVPKEYSNSNESMFIELERTGNWRVVYHKDTKVMYAVSCYNYNSGNFTLLVNADGTPMVYGGNK